MLALVAVFAISALLRALACETDFWLDEIWSHEIARTLDSPWHVLTRVHHSNNHHLLTFYLALLDADLHWRFYRLPSLLAGIASVVLAYRIAREDGRLHGLLAMLLSGVSYFGVYYASEARGYAPVTFFGLAAYMVLLRHVRRRDMLSALLFGALCILGFLCHLEFLHVFLAAGLWLLVHDLRTGRRGISFLRGMLTVFALPTLAIAVFYWFEIRLMTIGAGPEFRLLEILGSTAAWTLGVPPYGAPSIAALALFAVLTVMVLLREARREGDTWIFHLVVIAGAPAAVIGAMQPHVLFERYFAVGIAFFLILLGRLLADAMLAAGTRRVAAAILLVGMLVGNIRSIADFLVSGRGQYLEALLYMAEETGPGPIRIGSDNDFRNGTLLHFYERYLPADSRLEYCAQGRWPADLDWLLAHASERDNRKSPRSEQLVTSRGTTFFLQREFPYAAHSGWHWFVYRNEMALQR